MKLLTWNIQRGGGKRIPSIVEEIAIQQPDIVALTEVTSNNVASLRKRLVDCGYDHIESFCPTTNDNSVLLASKVAFQVAQDNIARDKERWLPVHIGQMNLNILCVHIPGATDSKFSVDGYGISGEKRKELFWNEVMRYAEEHKDKRTVLLGDFNTGLKEDAEGTPFKLSEFIHKLKAAGFIDTWRHLNPDAREYTWYWRRKSKVDGSSEDHNGFRLDYVFVSPLLRNSIVTARHLHHVREKKYSDHSMVVSELNLA